MIDIFITVKLFKILARIYREKKTRNKNCEFVKSSQIEKNGNCSKNFNKIIKNN